MKKFAVLFFVFLSGIVSTLFAEEPKIDYNIKKLFDQNDVKYSITSGCDFNSCWMNEDSLSLIINTGMKDKLLSLKDERNYVNGYDLAQFDISYFQTKECHPDVTALLYFSGYLTVKESSGSFSRGYYLEIPNREAMRSLENVIGSIR